MKRKIALTIIMTLISFYTVFASGTELVAVKTSSTIRLDTEEKNITAYLVNDNNYFKLRDIAYILNGTGKKFSVNWNEKNNVISIETNQPYVAMGGEAEVSDGLPQYSAIPTPSDIYIDGKKTEFTSYLINDNNYFKLRDLGEVLDFGVDWHKAENTVLISSTLGYYDVNPISSWDYQSKLEKGMDVDWSKTEDGKEHYNIKAVQDFKSSGVNRVRIRIKDKADSDLFLTLDKQIDDCIKTGIIPIIAYQADEFKNNPDEKNIQEVVDWWSIVAERYKEKSYLLSFDLLIEATDALNKQPEKLNEIYERIVTEVRKTNPQRIIMISPRLRSDSQYLSELKIPSQANGYIMAEWHFYAAGPSKDNDRKLWTIGTENEKKLITDKINYALDWQKKTGIPTWVGAWMPSNYNDGDDYSIEEQVVFADFMTSSLVNAKIPFAVNSDTKFYDRENNNWIDSMLPVFNTIFK